MNRFTPPQQKGGVKKGKSIMKQQLNKQGGDPYGIATFPCYQWLNNTTLKKRALFTKEDNFNYPDLFASLKINPVMFVMQSLCVAAFMLGLFAAVIIAAALTGVL